MTLVEGGIDRAPCHLLSAGGPGDSGHLCPERSLCQFPLETGFTWVSQSVCAFLVFLCGGKKRLHIAAHSLLLEGFLPLQVPKPCTLSLDSQLARRIFASNAQMRRPWVLGL